MLITEKNIKSDLKDIEIPKGLRLHIDAESSAFGEVEILVRPNYYDGFGKDQKPPIKTPLEKYLSDTTTKIFSKDDLCPEMPVPISLGKHIKLELPGKNVDRAVALLHAGRKGCIAPMHFDWDHDNVLHVCISGTRTFFLFPPDAGWLLSPVINTSALAFARFSHEDQQNLLKLLGGTEVTLHPGEAVLFPSMWWHCVRYDEASVGLSVRFADRADLRPFSVLPRSWWLQRLMRELFCAKKSAADIEKIFEDGSRVFFAPYGNWQERYRAFESWCRENLQRMGKHEGTEEWIGESFNPEIALAAFELEDLYTLPVQPTNISEKEQSEIKEYLFASFPSVKDSSLADTVTRYAFATRNGLPAKRGLILVV